MPANKKRTRFIILLSALAALIAVAVAAVIMIASLLSLDHIKNTSDALFFDLSAVGEIMSGDALEFSAEFDLPERLTGLAGDLHLALNSAADQSTDNGKSDVTLGLGENSMSLTTVYDAEAIAVGGLCTDANEFISLPRKNIKEAFDNSLFFYGSGSIHSMSMSRYNSLIPSIEALLDSEHDNSEDLKNTLEEIMKIAEPQSSFLFSKGKLCRKITYTFDKKIIGEMIEIIAAADATEQSTQLQELTEVIGDRIITVTYITDGKYITSAHISTDGFNADIDIICDGDACGFKADVKYTYAESTIKDIAMTSEFAITYRKRESDSEITANLNITHQSVTDWVFTLEKNDSAYTLKSNGKEVASGIFELDAEKLRFTVVDGESARTLVSFSLERPESIVTEMPAHRPLLEMDKDALTDFFRNIPMQKVNDLLKDIVRLDLSAYMTADGKLMLHADKVMDEAEKIYGPYVSLLKTTEKKLLDTVSKIYIWNDRLDTYILFTYSIEDDTLAVGCSYELTEEILADYHTAHIGENRIMFVHSIERTEKIEPTCTDAGKEVYKCEHCDYGYQVDDAPLGHENTFIYDSATSHDGLLKTVTITQCSRCGIIGSLSANDYCNMTLTPDGNGGYTISNFQAYKDLSFTYLCLPTLSQADIKFSGITVTQANGVFEAINIPEGIEKLRASSIFLADSFKVIILPSTLKEIESSAFYGSGKPSVIFFCGSEEDWKKVALNEYLSLWAEAEIIFCPNGITHDDISQRLFLSRDIEKAVNDQKTMILTADAAREAAKDDSVTLISEEKIAFVAYDEENSLIAYCGASSAMKTRIEIFDIKTEKTVASFEVNDYIHTLDIREGYVAMGSFWYPDIHIYDISTGETKKVRIDSDNSASEMITNIFIDSGYVYASTSSEYYLVAYSIKNEELKVIMRASTSAYELIMNHDSRRIIVIVTYYSQIDLHLIDTEKAQKIKEITFSDLETSALVEIPNFENVISTRLGVIYDWDGNPTSEKPLGTPNVKANIPEKCTEVSKFYEHTDGAMTLFAQSGQKVLLALQNAAAIEPFVLDYYAETAIVTAEGYMIIYTPSSYGLLLVKLS